MRRTLSWVVAIALFAVACSSGALRADAVAEDDTPQDAAAQALAAGQEHDDSATDAMADENPEPDTPDAAPAARLADAATCGFGDDLTPVDVEIAQIPGEERDTNPSALVGGHPDFPDPLVDPDQIMSGGPPPDGIPPIDAPRFQTAASVDWQVAVQPAQ